ncbi:MAG TPA: hypothetical protein GXX40_02170 [Firmicutes bacterium]|nr:hypothetical protein [Bacillota bacterium]
MFSLLASKSFTAGELRDQLRLSQPAISPDPLPGSKE